MIRQLTNQARRNCSVGNPVWYF